MIYKSTAIRVGQPGSPVDRGMPVPGNPGKYYENGQFAPDMDSLLTSVISEADSAGLVSKELPFLANDEIDDEKLKEWNPYEDYGRKGISVSGSVSKFSMAVIESINSTFPSLLTSFNINSIMTTDDMSNSRAIAGRQLITSIVKTQGRFKATLVVYPEFEQFITVPIVRAIKGRTSGVSVATYAVYKALGHILFSKMSYEGEMKLLGEFLEACGWTKKTSNFTEKGRYISIKSRSSYERTKDKDLALSEVERYSAQDEFADTFAQYMTHRRYMSQKFPEKYEIMSKIMEGHINAIQR